MCRWSIAQYYMPDMFKSRTTASRSEYRGYFNKKRKRSEMLLFKQEVSHQKKNPKKINKQKNPNARTTGLASSQNSHLDQVLPGGKMASCTIYPSCLCIDLYWWRGNWLTLSPYYSIAPALLSGVLRRPHLSICEVRREMLKWKLTETRKTIIPGE